MTITEVDKQLFLAYMRLNGFRFGYQEADGTLTTKQADDGATVVIGTVLAKPVTTEDGKLIVRKDSK